MSLPNATYLTRGPRDTGDDISQAKPLAISDKIWMHDPNANKALAWILRNGRTKEPTFSHNFGHMEAAPFANWIEHGGPDESVQLTTAIVLKTGHGNRITLGSRVFWPRIKEVMRLTAVMSTDTTGAVARNFGRGVAATGLLKAGDKGLIIAPSQEQGYTPGLALSRGKVYKSFSTSIVDWKVEVTGTEDTEKVRGKNIFRDNLAATIKSSKDQLEAELFFGAKHAVTSGTHPLTTAEGLDNWITTNRYTANSISRMDLWDILGEWKSLNKKGGVIMCSGAFKAMITMWAMGPLRTDQASKKDGLEIDQVLTPYGTFDLIEIDLLNQEPTLAGTVFFLPKGHTQYRPLIHDGDRDIKYSPINQEAATGVDKHAGHVWGEYGYEFFLEEMFAQLSGLRFTA